MLPQGLRNKARAFFVTSLKSAAIFEPWTVNLSRSESLEELLSSIMCEFVQSPPPFNESKLGRSCQSNFEGGASRDHVLLCKHLIGQFITYDKGNIMIGKKKDSKRNISEQE